MALGNRVQGGGADEASQSAALSGGVHELMRAAFRRWSSRGRDGSDDRGHQGGDDDEALNTHMGFLDRLTSAVEPVADY